jgi:Bacterial PH domain
MQTFAIAPAASKAVWLLPVVLIPVGIAVTIVVITLIGSRGSRFEVSPEGLRLRGDLYGRLIPVAELRTAEARRIDFEATPELQPRWRTLGTGLPGYQAGWFRLKGGERALLYLTDRSRAVYVPTTAGYSVVVSPADPDAFLRALESIPKNR